MRQGHAAGMIARLPGTLLFWGKFFPRMSSETWVSDDWWKCRLGKTVELREWIFSISRDISKLAAHVLGSIFRNQVTHVTRLALLCHWPAPTQWKKCKSVCWHSPVGQPCPCHRLGQQLQARRNLQRSVTSHMWVVVRISSAPGRKGPSAVPRLNLPCVSRGCPEGDVNGEFRFKWKLVCVSSSCLM